MGPLAGIRVLDLGQIIAGPSVSATLAALGADVIKVEPLGGEKARHMGAIGVGIFCAYNRGKRSIEVNLSADGGQAIVRSLVARADVVIANVRPGKLDALGLGPDKMCAAHPRLIYATVTGYPTDGESPERVGLDIAAQAESGMMSITGEADGDPQRTGFTVVDVATADGLVQAIMVALFVRERTGLGERIQVSLLETAVYLQAVNLGEFSKTGVEPMRRSGQPGIAPAADYIRVAGGGIVLSAYSKEHWPRLCHVIGRPELIEDPRFASNEARAKNRKALLQLLEDALAGMPRSEAIRLLVEGGIVVGDVRTYREVVAATDVVQSGMLLRTFDEVGDAIDVPRLPYRFATWRQSPQPVPRLGEHTLEVLADLGYDQDSIDELVRRGVVGTTPPGGDSRKASH